MCDCFVCVRHSPAAAEECGVLCNLVDIDQVWICGKWQMAYGIGFMLLALIYDFYDLAIVVIGSLMFVVFVILCFVSNNCKGPLCVVV